MQAIRTRKVPATNTRGARMQAKCEARTLYMPYDHALDLDHNHKAACEALLLALNWTPEHGRAFASYVGGFFGGDLYWVSVHDLSTSLA